MPPLKRILPAIFCMTSHHESNRTTDIKPEMLSGVQTGNGTPHDRYDIRGIAHANTIRKDNIFMQRRLGHIFTCILEWGQGTRKKSKPYPARAYTTLVVLVFLQTLLNFFLQRQVDVTIFIHSNFLTPFFVYHFLSPHDFLSRTLIFFIQIFFLAKNIFLTKNLFHQVFLIIRIF